MTRLTFHANPLHHKVIIVGAVAYARFVLSVDPRADPACKYGLQVWVQLPAGQRLVYSGLETFRADARLGKMPGDVEIALRPDAGRFDAFYVIDGKCCAQCCAHQGDIYLTHVCPTPPLPQAKSKSRAAT